MNIPKANAYINKGAAFFSDGDIGSAVKNFLGALKYDSNSVEANFNLGFCYQIQKDYQQAILYFRRTLKLKPDDIEAPNNLARSLANFGAIMLYKDPAKALECLMEASKFIPDNPNILYNIGNAYQAMGKTEESMETIKKVIEVDPEFEHAYGQYYLRLRTFAYWDEAKKIFKKMKKLTDASLKLNKLTSETPFISVCNFEDPKRNFEIAKIWSKQDKDFVSEIKFSPKYPEKRTGELIRIGYLSYDFHDHATLHLLIGVLRLHNKKRFKIYAYSYGFPSKSNYRRDAQKYVDVFRDIRLTSDLEAARIINKDKIDILVDLKGHTSGCRLGIMALKAAPVSVTWLGFPGTTGADYIDYILTDRIVTPPSEAKYYSEKIIYLPHTYQPTDNKQIISDRKSTRRNLGLPGDPDTIVFSSFNQTHKIEPKAFDSWMNILKRVPNGILWLFVDNKIAVNNLKNEAKKRGVNTGRLFFAGPLPKDEHLKRLSLSDLALDTFTYNGHTTTSDCLWAGVPVVTLKGHHFASRVSASLLTAIGMPELITNSVTEYERLAIELATNPKKLNAIRYKLSSKRLTEPLFNTEMFTRDLENIYEKVYTKTK